MRHLRTPSHVERNAVPGIPVTGKPVAGSAHSLIPSNIICYKCGIAGHFRSGCPNGKQESENARNRRRHRLFVESIKTFEDKEEKIRVQRQMEDRRLKKDYENELAELKARYRQKERELQDRRAAEDTVIENRLKEFLKFSRFGSF